MYIIPAILSEDSTAVESQLEKLKGAASWVQIDVMDDTYVPGSTVDLYDFYDFKDDFSFGVHLMVDDPVSYFPACEAIGAKRVHFHFSAVESPSAVLDEMTKYSWEKSIAISPSTAAEDIVPYVDQIDSVLVMSVMPGAQGGTFLPQTLCKVRLLKERYSQLSVGVDGGVNRDTIEEVFGAGADYVGVGSAISGASDPAQAIETLKKLID